MRSLIDRIDRGNPGPTNIGGPSSVPVYSLQGNLLASGTAALFNAEQIVGGVSFNPVTDPVTFTFGTASIVIPAGSFNKVGSSNSFWFASTVKGVSMFVEIQAQNPAATSYNFAIFATGLDLTGQKEPMSVGLQAGENTGSTTYKAFVF